MTEQKQAVVFITRGEYADKMYIEECNHNDLLLHWQGQRTGRDDSIVTNKTRIVHVCWREKAGIPYSYYGYMDNSTLRLVYKGDHKKKIPDSYQVKLKNKEHSLAKLREKLELNNNDYEGSGKFQKQAMDFLGFEFTFQPKGIYAI